MADDITWKVTSNRLTGEIQGQIRGLSREAVTELITIIRTDVMRRMHEPGRGRIYTRGGITHQASAPGQAPAAETGDLIASIRTEVHDTAAGPVGVVGSDLAKARPLEYGNGRVAPRPAWTPAGEAARKRAQAILTDHLRKVQ